MIKTIQGDENNNELIGLVANQAKKNLPVKTKAVFLTLKHLKDFIAEIEKRHNDPSAADFDPDLVCDAIKICFVRFKFKANNNQIEPAGTEDDQKEMTQTSLVFVPVKTASQVNWESKELFKNDGLRALYVCEPGIDDKNATGVCPPNKGCPNDSDGEG